MCVILFLSCLTGGVFYFLLMVLLRLMFFMLIFYACFDMSFSYLVHNWASSLHDVFIGVIIPLVSFCFLFDHTCFDGSFANVFM